jgi:hypothetical protein
MIRSLSQLQPSLRELHPKCNQLPNRNRAAAISFLVSSVADPDPSLFGPPGSGSGSISEVRIRILLSSSKNIKKTLGSYCFVTSFLLFILEKGCKYTF